MLNLIVLTIIFGALWSTDCYAHLVWDHLSRVETTFPQNGDGLVPTTTYHVIPGSEGMFLDVAEEIRSRMEGTARDNFIVVFDFGGVSPKYFSIIEELTRDAAVNGKTKVVKHTNVGRGILEEAGVAPNYLSTIKGLNSGEAPTDGMARPPNEQPITTSEDALVKQQGAGHGIREDVSESGDAPKYFSTFIELTPTPEVSSVDEIVAQRANNVTLTNEDAVAKWVANATPGDASAHGEAPEKIEIETIPLGELIDASSAIPYMSNATVTNSSNDENISPTTEDTTKYAQNAATELGEFNLTKISDTGIDLLQPTINQQSGDHTSITDQLTNETFNFTTLKRPLSPEDAIALTTSLKSSTDQVSLIIKKLSFNCVPFKPKALDVNVFIVDSMVLGEGTVCGLDTMKPSNNITVMKNESTIEVTIPLVFTNLTVKSKSIDVKKLFISIVTGLPIEASIKEIIYNANFVFEEGTPLKLKDVHLKWGNINGIHLKALEDQGLMSGIVDYIGEVLSGAVESFISPIFDEIENELSKTLLGTGIM